jgi:hypothetical protein
MTVTAKVIEKSISHHGVVLTTYLLRYPRFIHADFMTHRVFSRNASSSRAIPTERLIASIEEDPANFEHWGRNQKGMQAREELQGEALNRVKQSWHNAGAIACAIACAIARDMARDGAHKQIVNRTIENHGHINVVLTTTEITNWDELRAHPDADPTIEVLARAMQAATAAVEPVLRGFDRTVTRNWHLPFVSTLERAAHGNEPIYLAKLSAARCARTSYLTHEGKAPNAPDDFRLFNDLVGARPLHASPVEHQGTPAVLATTQSGNFRGWRQFRKVVEAHVECGEELVDYV